MKIKIHYALVDSYCKFWLEENGTYPLLFRTKREAKAYARLYSGLRVVKVSSLRGSAAGKEGEVHIQ